MRQIACHLALLTAVAGAIFFTNLGGPRLWDRDEPRNAGCAAEMMARNDWVTPVFDGQLRTHKPALLYWFMIAAYRTWGVNEFGARFWSAALGVGTVLCTYGIGRRLFHPRAGLWAGIVLATGLMFGVASRAATPDAVLIFFTTAALWIYVVAAFPRPGMANGPGPSLPVGLFPRSWPVAVALYAIMGLAVLAKGPVGLVLPTAVIGMYLLIVRLSKGATIDQITHPRRSRRIVARTFALLRPFAPVHFLRTCWSMRPITAVIVALAVAGPWYAWVGLRTDGAWLRGFLWEHNLGRAAGAMEGHGGPIVYYPIALLIGLFPWSALAGSVVLGMIGALRVDRLRPGTTFAACWVGVYIGLFSLASTKLPSYITPCYPGAALLIGLVLHRWTAGEISLGPIGAKAAWIVLATVGLGVAIGAPIASHYLLPGEEWLGAIGLPLFVGAALAWLWHQTRPMAASLSLASMAVAFTLAIFAVGAERVDRHQQSDKLLEIVRQRGSDAPVGAYNCLEPSWVFYAGRPIEELVHRPGGDSPRAFTTTPSGERVRRGDVHGFLAQDARATVITTDEHYERIRDELADGIIVLAEAPYFLQNERLVLLGRPEERLAKQAPHATNAGRVKRQ